MTCYRLSKATGVDYALLWRLLNGHTNSISFRTLEAVCLALDCTPNDLIEVSRGRGATKKRP